VGQSPREKQENVTRVRIYNTLAEPGKPSFPPSHKKSGQQGLGRQFFSHKARVGGILRVRGRMGKKEIITRLKKQGLEKRKKRKIDKSKTTTPNKRR